MTHLTRTLAALVIAWALLSLAALAQDETAPAGLVVYADQPQGTISPFVLASNFTPWTAIPVALMDQARALPIRYLRLGGGFSDEADLYPDFIDRFISVARLLDAEPAITVRLHNSSPEKSAESVRYTNLQMGYNVRYWSIGNEPSLFASLFRTDYDTERHAAEWRAHAEAMLAVDPTIILIGPDVHQYPGIPAANPRDAHGRDWFEAFLRANGDLVGIASIHRYPFPRDQANPVITIDDLRLNAREWDDHILPMARRVIREATGRDIPLAVTEINSSWANNIGGEATMDSHYNAIWYADVLGRMIRQGVEIAVYFDLQRRDRSFGILGGSDVRPVYYTFVLYGMFGTQLVPTTSDDPDTGVYAAYRDDGALTLMLVNLATEPLTRPLTLIGFEPGGMAEAWLLDPDHRAVEVDPVAVGDTISLPAQSVMLLVIPPAE